MGRGILRRYGPNHTNIAVFTRSERILTDWCQSVRYSMGMLRKYDLNDKTWVKILALVWEPA